jgi:Tol biopolymer transport system component
MVGTVMRSVTAGVLVVLVAACTGSSPAPAGPGSTPGAARVPSESAAPPPEADGSIYFAADAGGGEALTEPFALGEAELHPRPMDIYLSRRGQPVRRVIATGAHERCPAVSPDGARLAYLKGPTIVVAPLDAEGIPGAPEVRVDLKAHGLYRPDEYRPRLSTGGACPRWSPDGRRLGYLVVIGDPHRITYSRFDRVTAEVHAVTLDGRDRRLAAFDIPVWDFPQFAWSSDGDELAYTTADGVWRAQLHGGARKLVWRSPRGNVGVKQPMDYDRPVSVAWSSRDDIAFSVRRFIPTEPHNPMSGGKERGTLVVVDAGSGRVLLEAAGTTTEGGGAGEQWSPDGTRLVFTGSHGHPFLYERATGSTVRLRLPFEGTGGGYAPTWSPDGQVLLARARSNDRGFVLASFPLDGSSGEERTPWTWALDWAGLDDVDWSSR